MLHWIAVQEILTPVAQTYLDVLRCLPDAHQNDGMNFSLVPPKGMHRGCKGWIGRLESAKCFSMVDVC